MDDLQQDNPLKPSAETPAGGASAETDPEIELELEEVAESDQSDGTDDDLEDWEEEGKTYKVPKALKPRLMKDRDYTTKTQEIAEHRKQVEAQKAEFAEAQKFHRENIKSIAKIENVAEQMEAFRQVTPEQWRAMDAAQASKLRIEYDLLKDQYNGLYGELQQKQQQALEKQRTTSAKQYEDSLARIAKEIPNWSEEHASKLDGYATSKGATFDELQALVLKPWAVVALDKAYRYDQLVAKQRARATVKAEPEPTPVARVGARRSAPSSEPLDSDPPDVWMRKRNKQLGLAG
jgi:hypothetical protein